MFEEEVEWSDGAEPRCAPQAPGRPASAVVLKKRRRRRLPGCCAAEPGQDEEPARKAPGKRRRAAKRRAAAGEPRKDREQHQRPEGAAAGEPPRKQRRKKRGPKKEPLAGPLAELDSVTSGLAGKDAGAADRSETLRARMEERLLGARFRYLNERLYTSSSREAAQLFRSDPEAFEIYHQGFARQVARWPQNPTDRIVRYLRKRPASLVVADFGCGDCKVARSVPNKVHCFDLLPLCPRVTVCDMAQVPLEAESVDIGVFCLALMGTNLQEILEEANRVLKPGGTLLVAEVASRFESIRSFLSAMAQLGFRSVSKELRGFSCLEELLQVKGITQRVLELNWQRLHCGHRGGTDRHGPGDSTAQAGDSSEPPAQVPHADDEASEEDSGSWHPGHCREGTLAPVPTGSCGSGGPRDLSRVGGEQEEDEEEEEEEDEEEEEEDDEGNLYLYYSLGQRWLHCQPGRHLLRHLRPQGKRKSEPGGDGALAPGKKLCRGSEFSRTLGPCTPSPTTTFGDLRNAQGAPGRRRRMPSVVPPPELQDWLQTFQRWSGQEKLLALDELIDRCEPPQIRHMMQVIEPQFQRDFISLLPKELALYVLSFLEPRDLLRAAQTCRYWRLLAEDNLLWREKCREEGIEEPLAPRRRRLLSPGFMHSPWKLAFLRQHRIDANWRSGDLRPPKVLKGHDDHVITCLQFCGNRIVSGSDDNTLKVWSALTGECIQTLVGHTGGVWSSQLRGSTVISGSTDRTLRVWDADSGRCLHTLYGHTSTVRCMHLHGTRVVSGSRDATLRLWDIESGQCLHVLLGHVAAVRCVQYDGHRVVSGAYDYTVKVWDPDTESCTHTLQGHTNRVYSLQFDGIHIVSGSLDTSIRVWDVESGNCLHTLMGHQSLTSGMELRDNILVSGNADSTVKIWDIKTGQCLQTLQGPSKHQSAVTCLQFSSKFVVTSSDDGTVKLWDLRTGEFLRNLVALESGGSGGVVWRIRASNTKLVCAVGSRNGTEETKLLVLDFEVDLK
ncbi:ribosomal RNA-processing protein 8 isoform X2 [Melanerpes formicivorus]|uniref:ribosomal RNA-processing protein 8 isoform X2 n=1 Tax=Melanerpes formicivorus TaxID=211600 RepID=UPI0035902AF6